MSDAKKNPAAVKLGRLGGAAGTGKAKRRSPEHYARISRIGGLAPKKNRKKPMSDLQKRRALAGKVAGNSAQKRTARRAAKINFNEKEA
jgi:hypothetical protein